VPELEKTLTVRLDDEERAFVDAKAKEEGRSKGSWLRRLIRREMAAEVASRPPSKRPK
jgi:predicted HicB family RNase H-like nuclease